MPTYTDPRRDSVEASVALRGLAHASRVFDNPADTYVVLGDLLDSIRSLRQVLDQLAATHVSHRARAHDDDGEHAVGEADALAAADDLHQAGTLLDDVEMRVDAAMTRSGRIAWHPAPAAIDHENIDTKAIDAEAVNVEAVDAEAPRRWIGVVFLQGEEADEVLDLIDRDGLTAALDHLKNFDYGEETTDAALVNGYVYDTPPAGTTDTVVEDGDYTLTYSRALGHVSLLRTYTASDPDLDEPPSVGESISTGDVQLRQRPRSGERDWFAGPAGSSSSSSERGLVL
mgnify:CR=1 FL=1